MNVPKEILVMYPDVTIKENCQYICSVPGHVTTVFPLGKLRVNLEVCQRKFLSGSFAVTLQCSHQCDHSVPGLEILKEPKQCTKDVPNQYICSVLGVFLQCTAFGKIWGNSGDTASTFQMFQVLQFSWHVLAVSPEFPQILPEAVHCRNTPRTLQRY